MTHRILRHDQGGQTGQLVLGLSLEVHQLDRSQSRGMEDETDRGGEVTVIGVVLTRHSRDAGGRQVRGLHDVDTRNLMDDLRNTGVVTGGGPPGFSKSDRQAFANQLDRFLRSKCE